MISSIIRHGKPWLFHWGVCILTVVAFMFIFNNPLSGAVFAAGGYTWRERQEIINHSAPKWLEFLVGKRTSEPTLDKWIDHFGDLLGAFLTVLITWMITR